MASSSLISTSLISIRTTQPLHTAANLSPKAPIIYFVYLLKTFDDSPTRTYFKKGAFLLQTTFQDLSHATSPLIGNASTISGLPDRSKEASYFYISVSYNVPVLWGQPCSQKKILCHLNHSVTFIPLLCSHCWLICFARYSADVLDLTSTLNLWGEWLRFYLCFIILLPIVLLA